MSQHNTLGAKQAVKQLIKATNNIHTYTQKRRKASVGGKLWNKYYEEVSKSEAMQLFYSAQLKYNNYSATWEQMVAKHGKSFAHYYCNSNAKAFNAACASAVGA